jgi:FMN phosphatase YigB (HAD superfamily)
MSRARGCSHAAEEQRSGHTIQTDLGELARHHADEDTPVVLIEKPGGPMKMIRSVVFDVGETLLDDTPEWGRWADWIGVPRHTFSTVLGAVTAAGRDNADTFQYFRPGFDVVRERALREEAGRGEHIDDTDLYPDVCSALAALQAAGLWVGVAGNQTTRAAELLRGLDLPANRIATSGEWGIAKPDTEFFRRVVAMSGCPAERVLYVGDHRDNDIVPAKTAGLRTALIRRGPWGYLWAGDPIVLRDADWVIDSLDELPGLLSGS